MTSQHITRAAALWPIFSRQPKWPRRATTRLTTARLHAHQTSSIWHPELPDVLDPRSQLRAGPRLVLFPFSSPDAEGDDQLPVRRVPCLVPSRRIPSALRP